VPRVVWLSQATGDPGLCSAPPYFKRVLEDARKTRFMAKSYALRCRFSGRGARREKFNAATTVGPGSTIIRAGCDGLFTAWVHIPFLKPDVLGAWSGTSKLWARPRRQSTAFGNHDRAGGNSRVPKKLRGEDRMPWPASRDVIGRTAERIERSAQTRAMQQAAVGRLWAGRLVDKLVAPANKAGVAPCGHARRRLREHQFRQVRRHRIGMMKPRKKGGRGATTPETKTLPPTTDFAAGGAPGSAQRSARSSLVFFSKGFFFLGGGGRGVGVGGVG